jgi:hypothetical protein
MQRETKDTVNSKEGMLKNAKDIVEHLTGLGVDIAHNVLTPQGAATLADLARTALERMVAVVNALNNMSEDQFVEVPGTELAEKGKENHKHAQGHEGGQGLRSHKT